MSLECKGRDWIERPVSTAAPFGWGVAEWIVIFDGWDGRLLVI